MAQVGAAKRLIRKSIGARNIRRIRTVAAKMLGRKPPRRPILGIVGFFGHGNFGDELFLDVYHEYFGDDYDLVVLPDLLTKPYFSGDIKKRVGGVDAILLGGGDLLQPWAYDSRYWSRAYLDKPIYILGLGVPIRAKANQDRQKDDPDTIDRHREFFTHPNVKYIGTRDDASKQWIEKNLSPSVPVHSDPDVVCSLTLPPATKEATPTLGIVTRLRKVGEQDDYTELGKLARHVQGNGWKVKHIILGTGVVGERDVKDAEALPIEGKELVYSEDLNVLNRTIGSLTALASMKFHGSVVATMYGVPSVVLIPTSKNRSFMRRIGREDLLAKYDAPDLIDRFQPAPAPITPEQVAMLRDGAKRPIRDVQKLLRRTVG